MKFAVAVSACLLLVLQLSVLGKSMPLSFEKPLDMDMYKYLTCLESCYYCASEKAQAGEMDMVKCANSCDDANRHLLHKMMKGTCWEEKFYELLAEGKK